MNYLDIDTRSIKIFKSNNARKVDLGNRLLRLSHYLRDMLLHIEFDSFVEHLLIQNVFRHFQEALIFAMRGEATMCLSLTRIGVEGTRDLLRILENSGLTALYVEGPKNKENRKLWRESFRFDEEKDAPLLELYNICSDFGIHSRVPLMDPVGEVTSNGGQNFLSIGQAKHAKEAFVLALHAIEFSNIRIMETAKPMINSISEDAEKYSNLWWVHYSETSKLTRRYFSAFRKNNE